MQRVPGGQRERQPGLVHEPHAQTQRATRTPTAAAAAAACNCRGQRCDQEAHELWRGLRGLQRRAEDQSGDEREGERHRGRPHGSDRRRDAAQAQAGSTSHEALHHQLHQGARLVTVYPHKHHHHQHRITTDTQPEWWWRHSRRVDARRPARECGRALGDRRPFAVGREELALAARRRVERRGRGQWRRGQHDALDRDLPHQAQRQHRREQLQSEQVRRDVCRGSFHIFINLFFSFRFLKFYIFAEKIFFYVINLLVLIIEMLQRSDATSRSFVSGTPQAFGRKEKRRRQLRK